MKVSEQVPNIHKTTHRINDGTYEMYDRIRGNNATWN